MLTACKCNVITILLEFFRIVLESFPEFRTFFTFFKTRLELNNLAWKHSSSQKEEDIGPTGQNKV
jgi:hypothetical protein